MVKDDILQVKKSEIEEIIDKKVDERVEQEVQKLENRSEIDDSEEIEVNGLDRRDFLKKTGLGIAGLAALTLPGKALDIKDDSFNVYTGDSSEVTEYFKVTQSGNVEIVNTDLNMNNGSITDLGSAEYVLPDDFAIQSEVDGKADDPHGNEDHSEDFAVDGDSQPPENHGNEAHTETFATEDDVEGVPSGVITMWSGSETDTPDGWSLCDGSNGTPDLRDRFVVGAGGDYGADETGGAKEVALTESEMPSHSHSVTEPDGFGQATPGAGSDPEYVNSTTSTSTGSEGSGDAHENRPPYYALAFIMKV